MSTSHSLRSPRLQPVTKNWPHGEKQQAATLASLTALHLGGEKQEYFTIDNHHEHMTIKPRPEGTVQKKAADAANRS